MRSRQRMSATQSTNTSTTKLAETIEPSATVSLGSSLNPSTAGKLVTFTATVSGGSGMPSGSLALQTARETSGNSELRNGLAIFKTSTLALGGHTITAIYSGNRTYAPTSTTITQTVNPKPSRTSPIAMPGNPAASPNGTVSSAPASTNRLTIEAQAPGVVAPTIDRSWASPARCLSPDRSDAAAGEPPSPRVHAPACDIRRHSTDECTPRSPSPPLLPPTEGDRPALYPFRRMIDSPGAWSAAAPQACGQFRAGPPKASRPARPRGMIGARKPENRYTPLSLRLTGRPPDCGQWPSTTSSNCSRIFSSSAMLLRSPRMFSAPSSSLRSFVVSGTDLEKELLGVRRPACKYARHGASAGRSSPYPVSITVGLPRNIRMHRFRFASAHPMSSCGSRRTPPECPDPSTASSSS